MSYILAFAGSNSSTSINYKLVQYSISLLVDEKCQLLNMANYPFPMFSEDYEKENGFSNSLVEFKNDILNAKALVIGVNEHNSYPSAYFKNVLDWLSRVDKNVFADKKILLMATSPGGRGAIGALDVAEKMLTRFGGVVVDTFSLSKFYDNFKDEEGIVNEELRQEHYRKIKIFKESISK